MKWPIKDECIENLIDSYDELPPKLGPLKMLIIVI